MLNKICVYHYTNHRSVHTSRFRFAFHQELNSQTTLEAKKHPRRLVRSRYDSVGDKQLHCRGNSHTKVWECASRVSKWCQSTTGLKVETTFSDSRYHDYQYHQQQKYWLTHRLTHSSLLSQWLTEPVSHGQWRGHSVIQPVIWQLAQSFRFRLTQWLQKLN